eukprot:TRINITY_DN1754_c0_g1_i1.p1 TRINITY_DN1754_c0_g1~~TRINITY_DN1754_c0_g1_i1.p1  ORF type:complete len:551 (-),score=135.33 TRINITY_DN1754_c0_g1_i1:124-1608(-)
MRISALVNAIPGLKNMIDQEIEKEVEKAIGLLFRPDEKIPKFHQIPERGIPKDELVQLLKTLRKSDANAKDGNTFAYVYENVVIPEHEEVINLANQLFLNENALNPAVFPALRKFETEAVKMTASMLNAPPSAVGSMTSGGTESILVAVKTYRDYYRATRPEILEPVMIIGATGHPAWHKGAKYFGLRIIVVPSNPNTQEIDVNAMERAITSDTILLIASAPQYPHGIVDPIEDIGQLAQKHGVSLHVDACVGGFMLPWVEKLDANHHLPKWDFRVPGVSSMSADLHKYGYAPKGSSVVVYRNSELRKYQFYVMTDWPGGLFVSPMTTGTRGGGAIASGWSSLVHLGSEGFLKVQSQVLQTAKYLINSINQIEGLQVIGDPQMTLLSFKSVDETSFSIHVVADLMEERGWTIERQQLPDSIHLTVMPTHDRIKEKFIGDLKECVKFAKSDKTLKAKGTAALYGLVASIPDKAIVENFLLTFLDKVYRVEEAKNE